VGRGRRRGGGEGPHRVDPAGGVAGDIGVDALDAVDEPCANSVSRTVRAAFVTVGCARRGAAHAAAAIDLDARAVPAAGSRTNGAERSRIRAAGDSASACG
jgi:hypothetical protein